MRKYPSARGTAARQRGEASKTRSGAGALAALRKYPPMRGKRPYHKLLFRKREEWGKSWRGKNY
ncbi:hypothetical protein HMPREF1986_01355 [Oribacterium sp. oral taxon 078 str. F0263]|nr:hypothetical protein HMPREF1986_01355 [Oribacterium sp. oral taxon 078 str. F0263]